MFAKGTTAIGVAGSESANDNRNNAKGISRIVEAKGRVKNI